MSDCSSDVCSSDLIVPGLDRRGRVGAVIAKHVLLEGNAAGGADIHQLLRQVIIEGPGLVRHGDRHAEFRRVLSRRGGAVVNCQHGGDIAVQDGGGADADRSEEHTSELQSLMRISYAVFCLKKKKENKSLT